MFSILYVFWFLFPLTFFFLWIWSVLKPLFKVPGREDSKSYFSQFVFCLVGFWIAIAIDQTENFANLVDSLSYGMLDLKVARFLLYPVVLVLMAYIQKLFSKKKEEPRVLMKKY